jgi:hypothetical protein
MLSIEILIIALAAIYFAATVYTLISQKKPANILVIPDLISSINNRGGGWVILVPIAALAALLYNFVVVSFWFIGVIFHFIAWLLKWVWNEVIVAGGYFIFSILWHYLIKWPWKLLLLSFGKLLSSMKLSYIFTGTIALFISLAVMFLGRYFQMLFNTGIWITYLFAILAIIPIGVGISWIIHNVMGKSRDEAKEGAKRYVTHLSFIILTLIGILLIQAGLVYIGSFTSLSSVFSSLLAGGNLLGSFLVLINSIVIIFSLGALPSFSQQYQGENKQIVSSFFKYLINHNWGKYVIAAPAMFVPMIIACIIPYFLTQGISYMADRVSDAVFESRLSQLKKTEGRLPGYNYNDWLNVEKTSDDSLKVWKQNDLKRVNASLDIINTESTKAYLETFYKAHASMYAAAPVGALYYLFDKFYTYENEVVNTTPYSPLTASIDTMDLNDLNTKKISQIEESIDLIGKRIDELNLELAAVCDTSRNNLTPTTSETPPQQTQPNAIDNQQNLDMCAIQRANINNQISDALKAKLLAQRTLERAKDVASHLSAVYKLEKSSNSNSEGASKLAYLFVSLWLCLLIALAFSPVVPIFAQVNHSIFTESDNSPLFVMERIRSATSANPNQPLLGVSLFALLLIAQPIIPIPGINNIKIKLPDLPNIQSVLNNNLFSIKEAEVIAPEIDSSQILKDTLATPIAEAPVTELQDLAAESVLTLDNVDEKPEFIGSNFEFNDNLHVENGAPDDMYEVVVSYIVEADGSISNISTSTNNGYGLEDEIVNAINNTSGQWSPAKKEGEAVRCLVTDTFRFPQEK